MPTALLSVYHKPGIEKFAQALVNWGWDILASGGTAAHLELHDVPCRDVAVLVGEPLLGHRVVTLSREVHAGLLARDTQEDRAELVKRNIPFIDLVYVTLYPLLGEIENPKATLESIREKTDIGGPTLLRAAAKGERLVISSASDAGIVLKHLAHSKGQPTVNPDFRRMLAFRAERTAAEYTVASAFALCPPMEDRSGLHQAYQALTGKKLEELMPHKL